MANTSIEFIDGVNCLSNNEMRVSEIENEAKVFVSKKIDNFAIAKRLY